MSCTTGTTISAATASQALLRNEAILWGPWTNTFAKNNPFLALLPNGTFPANQAKTLYAPRQLRTNTSVNLAAPSFTDFNDVCGSCDAGVDDNGADQYAYNPQVIRQTSKKICLSQSFESFSETLVAMYRAVQQNVTEIRNADIRYQLFLNSGLKAVVLLNTDVEDMITGTEYDYQTPVPTVQSDARLTFALAAAMNRFMRTNVRATPYGGMENGYAKLIASPDELDALRADLGGGNVGNASIMPLGALAAGGEKSATNNLKGYILTDIYRGLQFIEDRQALRLNYTGSAYVPVNPNVPVAATSGTGAKINPGYVQASHEVAFLVFEGSFRYDSLAPFTGEGKIRFAKQLWGGDIQFVLDNTGQANIYRDFGVLAYQVGRALRPLAPEFIMPIIFKRCQSTGNTVSCSGVSGL